MPYLDKGFNFPDKINMQERRATIGKLRDYQLFFEAFVESSKDEDNTSFFETPLKKTLVMALLHKNLKIKFSKSKNFFRSRTQRQHKKLVKDRSGVNKHLTAEGERALCRIST